MAYLEAQVAGNATLTGSLSAVGFSETRKVTRKRYNMSVWGTFTGTIQLQRSFDDGATWLVCKEASGPYEGVGIEVEAQVQYRFEVTAHTSGTINFRLGLTSL
jgi:hypothetical protein